MVNQAHAIPLGDLDGWLFRQGNGPGWEKNNIDTKNWQPLKPIDISKKLVDKNGRLEGWLRLKIKADTAFGKIPFDINLNLWAAADLYIDGNLLYSFGNTGSNGKPYREYNPTYKLPLAFNIKKGQEHLLALHTVDYLSPLPPYNLKSSIGPNSIIICLPAHKSGVLNELLTNITFKTIWISVNIILCCLFWLLAFQNKRKKTLCLSALLLLHLPLPQLQTGIFHFPV